MIESWLRDYLPSSGRVALDVGANVGSFTVYLADHFDEVHAFEPHPGAFAELERNASRVNVGLHNFAVGNQLGEIMLNTFSESVHTSAFDDSSLDTLSRGPAAGRIKVKIMSIDGDGLLGFQNEPVDFIKIDTEGFEYEVLKGAEETLRANLPALLIEIHKEETGEMCRELLAQIGYLSERIPHPHGRVPAGHHWIAAPRP